MEYKLATSTWDQQEIKAINDVIDSDHYSMGSKVKQFEEDFASFFGSKFAVMTSSGSTANLIAVGALFYAKDPKLKAGDEVIVPAVSWSTTYFPLQQYGLKLKFVDIDLETLNFNLTDLATAVTDSTKAIMAVNLLGNSNDFLAIKKIIGSRSIALIEDNCESMGSTFDGKYAGTFGLMGTFSSFFSHHMSTMEGGMVLTDDEEYYHILLCMRAHGWTRNLPFENKLVEKSLDAFEESYRFILPGYNVRPLEMSGAIGIEQLKKLPSFINKRRDNAALFESLFENDPDFQVQKEIGDSSWFGFSLIIRPTSKIKRSQVIEALNEANIECRPIVTGNFASKEVVTKYFDFETVGSLPNATHLDTHGLFVGNSHLDLTQEIEHLRKVLRGLVGRF